MEEFTSFLAAEKADLYTEQARSTPFVTLIPAPKLLRPQHQMREGEITVKVEIQEMSELLVCILKTMEEWVRTGDQRAEPYLASNAIGIMDGRFCFHKDRLIEVLRSQGAPISL